LMPMKMAAQTKANVAIKALREYLEEVNIVVLSYICNIILYIRVSFVKNV